MAFWNESDSVYMRKIAWSRALIFRLIDAYRTEPMLWNPHDPNFKYRAKKRAAVARIAQDLKLPLPAVRHKLDILKGTYHKYRRAREARGGELPARIWFAYDRLSFLAPDYKPELDASNFTTVKMEREEETTYTITYNTQKQNSQQETNLPRDYDPPPPSTTPSVQRSQPEHSQSVGENLLQLKYDDRETYTWSHLLASTVGLMVRKAGPRPEPEMWRLQDSIVQLLRRFHNGEFAEEPLEESPGMVHNNDLF
ncbi:uncharacterized protein LOC126568876 [Anopheles aquasalis]|uniref:uncharacterized protein LOC126568876 n=1 Tax=Anopheles aquasalis TaxID=42839 RepID=UPI00215A2937|nr:uncharacterized protein LOC126568876 [Anopheles aquasalis]